MIKKTKAKTYFPEDLNKKKHSHQSTFFDKIPTTHIKTGMQMKTEKKVKVRLVYLFLMTSQVATAARSKAS